MEAVGGSEMIQVEQLATYLLEHILWMCSEESLKARRDINWFFKRGVFHRRDDNHRSL
jgi:hypothetical protein